LPDLTINIVLSLHEGSI